MLPSGRMEIPLEKASSGQLVMVICAFDATHVGGSGAQPTQSLEFHAEFQQTASSACHPEATQQGPASEHPSAPHMGDVLQRAVPPRCHSHCSHVLMSNKLPQTFQCLLQVLTRCLPNRRGDLLHVPLYCWAQVQLPFAFENLRPCGIRQ